MHLTISELLDYTDEEREKWKSWFTAQGNNPLKIALAGEATPNLGALILHIFWAELFYAYWMGGEVLSKESEVVKQNQTLPNDQAEAIFGFGDLARKAMRAFTDSAGQAEWDRIYEMDGFGVHLGGPARKLIAHILVHEIRHWAQMAITVRQHGLAPPGDHDLVFSKSFGSLGRRIA
jgi:uncharacterized damage-inducible protein DinB